MVDLHRRHREVLNATGRLTSTQRSRAYNPPSSKAPRDRHSSGDVTLELAENSYFESQIVVRDRALLLTLHCFVGCVFLVGGLAGASFAFFLAAAWALAGVAIYFLYLAPARIRRERARRRFDSAMKDYA